MDNLTPNKMKCRDILVAAFSGWSDVILSLAYSGSAKDLFKNVS